MDAHSKREGLELNSVLARNCRGWGVGGGGFGGLSYERGGDARHLAGVVGCKFRTLVSLRVFWAKRYI